MSPIYCSNLIEDLSSILFFSLKKL